jgi:L-ribulose-5-phosphate 4-epimerase
MTNWQEAKRIVLETALKMVEKGLVVGKSGNVSLRLPPERGKDLLAITPSRREYDLLTVDDIQVIDFNGKTVEGNLVPSVETMLHIGIYQARKNIRAVIHTHSVYATAVGVAGLEIPPIVEDQVNFLGGEIKAAGYAPSGSDELVANVVAALGERNAALLPNHGAVGIGPTMRQAFTSCEIMEKTARIYLYARSLGNVNTLSDEAVAACKGFFTSLQNSGE